MCAGNRIRKVCNRWYYKKLDFFKALPVGVAEKGVCFQWMLKIVSATVYGFLH